MTFGKIQMAANMPAKDVLSGLHAVVTNMQKHVTDRAGHGMVKASRLAHDRRS